MRSNHLHYKGYKAMYFAMQNIDNSTTNNIKGD